MSWRSLIVQPAVEGDDWSRISTVRLSLDRRLIHVGGACGVKGWMCSVTDASFVPKAHRASLPPGRTSWIVLG